MRRKSHVRCGVGENPEITSKDYLSLSIEIVKMVALVLTASIIGTSLACLLIQKTQHMTLSPVGISISCGFMLVYILFSMLALYLVTKKEDISEVMKGE